MACAIDDTVGGASANSYASIADTTAYYESHLYGDAWTDASADEQCRALVMATRMLDTWFDWQGDVASSTQALLWPRDGVYGPSGYEEATDEIPALIREAVMELARSLLLSDRTADSETETQGIEALKAGSVALQFRAGTVAKPIPDAVLVKASHYGTQRGRGGPGGIDVKRG